MAEEKHNDTDDPSITERIPRMRPGETPHNIAIGYGYFILILVSIVFLPVALGIVVGKNYGGVAEKLSRLPGISPSGGAKSGCIVGAVALFVWVPFILNAGAPSVTTIGEFEDEVEDDGIEVQGIEDADGLIGLDYYAQDPSNPVTYDEIATIATTYAELVDSGYETYSVLFGPVSAEDMNDVFHIDAALAQEYADGDISEEEYMVRIM